MKDFPQTIKVGGNLYSVLYPPQIKGSLAGECDHDRCIIQVSQDQGLEMAKSTLLHESIHASAYAMDWNIREATVVKIEKMMFSLLRDNPEFVKWLIAK